MPKLGSWLRGPRGVRSCTKRVVGADNELVPIVIVTALSAKKACETYIHGHECEAQVDQVDAVVLSVFCPVPVPVLVRHWPIF
jgi:hypothetical protein